MSDGSKATEASAVAGMPKPSPSRSARFERLLSGLSAGPLLDIDPDKLKGEIRRWARAVAALARQLSLGAWPETSDGSSEHQNGGDDGMAG